MPLKMANDLFRFQQFEINQAGCGMRISEDAVCFGAWCELNGCNKVIDIGAGTGLLSLMIAQRFPEAQIDAIELDEIAAKRCQENFQASPFTKRLSCSQGDALNAKKQKYDLVICNPPFFHEGSRTEDAQRDLARNSEWLTFDKLASAVNNLFQANSAQFIVPELRHEELSSLMRAEGYHLKRHSRIFAKANKRAHRSLLHFTKEPKALIETEILMRSEDNNYTASYNKLCEGFYLRR